MTSGRTDWVWTPAKEEQLTLLWADGYSASEIAYRLGSITRSGILGKVNRMGLPRRREPGQPRDKYLSPTSRKRAPKKPTAKVEKPKPTFKMPPSRAPHPPAEPVAFTASVWSPLPGSTPVTLADLSGCKWPVSDPFAPVGSIDLFCNCEQLDGKPYCAEHQARSVGEGTKSEQAAVKVASSLARLEVGRGDEALERRWDRAA